ncbi:MAG: MBL fold metallo-hydrolase [Opitutaceae bacterium]
MRPPPSDHFNGKRFFQPGKAAVHGLPDFIRWRRTRRPAPWPDRVPVEPAILPPAPRAEGISLTWIGHSSFLLQTSRTTWLTDPVFSERIGPVRGFGPRRVADAALSPSTLPPIDGILLSHDHYDHCDLPSLRALAPRAGEARAPVVATPLNYGSLLKAFQSTAKLVELDWWQSWSGPGGSVVQLVPSRHWCRRRIWGANERLWGGYFLRTGGRAVYFAGDSGFDERLFAEIRERCGAPDLALLPIGAYEPRWFMRDTHMNPEEAARVHRILGARVSVAMHWGAFRLADEAREAPPRALAEALAKAEVPADAFRVLPIGGSLAL